MRSNFPANRPGVTRWVHPRFPQVGAITLQLPREGANPTSTTDKSRVGGFSTNSHLVPSSSEHVTRKNKKHTQREKQRAKRTLCHSQVHRADQALLPVQSGSFVGRGPDCTPRPPAVAIKAQRRWQGILPLRTLKLQMEGANLSSTTDESRVQLMSLEWVDFRLARHLASL